MKNITNIENLRKFIEKENFHCVEIYDKAGDMILFSFKTNDEKRTVHVIYTVDKDGTPIFRKAHIVNGTFDYFLDYLEVMLLTAQCTYIQHYNGTRFVDLSRYDKVPIKKTKAS